MKNPIQYGGYTALGLIVYFILMKLAGQEANFVLRFFNFLIVIAGIYFLFKKMYGGTSNFPSYFEGLGSGLVLTVTAVVLFVGFMAIYVPVIDPDFIHVLENSQIWGNNLTLAQAAFAIIIEGIASGAVISFALMQHFKRKLS